MWKKNDCFRFPLFVFRCLFSVSRFPQLALGATKLSCLRHFKFNGYLQQKKNDYIVSIQHYNAEIKKSYKFFEEIMKKD